MRNKTLFMGLVDIGSAGKGWLTGRNCHLHEHSGELNIIGNVIYQRNRHLKGSRKSKMG